MGFPSRSFLLPDYLSREEMVRVFTSFGWAPLSSWQRGQQLEWLIYCGPHGGATHQDKQKISVVYYPPSPWEDDKYFYIYLWYTSAWTVAKQAEELFHGVKMPERLPIGEANVLKSWQNLFGIRNGKDRVPAQWWYYPGVCPHKEEE